MKKSLLPLLVVIAAFAVIAACSSDNEEAAPATKAPATAVPASIVKLGLLSPQTGPLAVYAAGFQDASAVAIEMLNSSQNAHVYELVIADSACDGTAAATSAQSLVDAGVSAIIGAACSGATLGAIAVAAPAGIPMVSYASTSPAVTNADDDGLLFRVVPSDAQQAVALSHVVDQSGVSSPAVI